MKKLLLVVTLIVPVLSGCYVAPYPDHDDGYRRDRDHHDDDDRRLDRDDRDDGHGGEHHDRDGYR